MARDAEAWLAGEAPWPFWGLPSGAKRHTDLDAERMHRQTERDIATHTATRAKSVFQLVGAGQVGPGSLRGMATLRRLAEAGFSIWPFDAPGWPLVIEIYPRLLTGEVNKSLPTARREHLRRYAGLDADRAQEASDSEHAFDAALSALVMNRYVHEIMDLEPLRRR